MTNISPSNGQRVTAIVAPVPVNRWEVAAVLAPVPGDYRWSFYCERVRGHYDFGTRSMWLTSALLRSTGVRSLQFRDPVPVTSKKQMIYGNIAADMKRKIRSSWNWLKVHPCDREPNWRSSAYLIFWYLRNVRSWTRNFKGWWTSKCFSIGVSFENLSRTLTFCGIYYNFSLRTF